MIDAHLSGKVIQTSEISRFIIGGQTGVDGIRFCLAPVIGGEDMTSLSWSWFLVFKNLNGAGESIALTPIFEDGLVKLPWVPGVTATQVPGKLEIQIYATQSSGEDIIKKWVSERKIIYIQEAVDPTQIIPTTPTLLEQFLTTFTSLKEEAEEFSEAAQVAQAAVEEARDNIEEERKELERISGPIVNSLKYNGIPEADRTIYEVDQLNVFDAYSHDVGTYWQRQGFWSKAVAVSDKIVDKIEIPIFSLAPLIGDLRVKIFVNAVLLFDLTVDNVDIGDTTQTYYSQPIDLGKRIAISKDDVIAVGWEMSVSEKLQLLYRTLPIDPSVDFGSREYQLVSTNGGVFNATAPPSSYAVEWTIPFRMTNYKVYDSRNPEQYLKIGELGGLDEIEAIGLKVDLTYNVLNHATSVNATYINASGTLSAGTTSYWSTDFIAWGDETDIAFGTDGEFSVGIFSAAQYDSDKVFIAGSWTGSSAYLQTIAKYAGASYIRVTYTSQNQFNFGTEMLPFIKFGYRIREADDTNPVYFRPDPNDITPAPDLPDISIQAPKKIYTVFNDLKGTGLTDVRFNSIPLWFDSLVTGITDELDIDFAESGNERVLLYAPVLDTDTLVEEKEFNYENSELYADGILTFKQYNTKESVGATDFPKILAIGDSVTTAFLSNVGNPDTTKNPTNYSSVIKEQFEKAKIDAGDTDHDALMLGTGLTTWDMDYDTVSGRTLRACNAGVGGWCSSTFLYWSKDWSRFNDGDRQGLWDLLGLGDGTGSDYAGTTIQVESLYTTPEGAYTPKDTSAFLLYIQTYVDSGVTDYASAVVALNALEADPTNKFYNYTKAQTDDVAFSIETYLDRYKTLASDGSTRLIVGSTAGTEVTDETAYDVCLPTHIIIQHSHNDGNVAWFGENMRKWTDSIKAEYTANGWGTVNIGISVIRHTGTFYPQRYPEFNYDDICLWDNQETTGFSNYARIIDEFWVDDANEDSEHIYILPSLNIQPPAWSTPFREVNSPEFNYTGQLKHSLKVMYGAGATYHPNGFCHRVWGCEMYAWIRYTLSL